MFGKIKNNPSHMLIMDQINDVENCLIQFESFVRASCVKETSSETLTALAEEYSVGLNTDALSK